MMSWYLKKGNTYITLFGSHNDCLKEIQRDSIIIPAGDDSSDGQPSHASIRANKDTPDKHPVRGNPSLHTRNVLA